MWGRLMVGLSGVVHNSTENGKPKRVSKLLKPLFFLLLVTVLVSKGQDEPQFIWVAIGLLLASITDLFGLFSKISTRASFSALVLSFLFYSKGFWTQLHGDIAWWLPALLLAGSIILILLLLPKLDTIIFPVSVMGAVLVQMSWATSAVWMSDASVANLYACFASLLFVAATLKYAINIYRHSDRCFDIWTSSCFFIAHTLIVASVIA